MTDYKVTEFGKTKDGKDAHLYLLENKNGLKAYVSDFGASLVRLFVPDKNGTMLDVVHGYDNAAGYERETGESERQWEEARTGSEARRSRLTV